MENSAVERRNEIGLFVGDTLAFSDNILRHTAAEFTSVHFIRIPMLTDLFNLTSAELEQCRIIVVDEGQADELRQNLTALFQQCKKTRVALSYRRATIANGFLRQASTTPLLAKVGILPMRLEYDHWISVLRLLICGERYIPYDLLNFPELTRAEVEMNGTEKRSQTKPDSRLAKLTERETQVLNSVSEGKQNKVIAAELKLSEHTVKLHIHNAISKLGVKNRTEAAIRYLADQPALNNSV